MQHIRTLRHSGCFAWHVGVDANPLCRRWDRIEAVVVAVLIVVACAMIPVAWWVGHAVYDAGVRTAATQTATRIPTTATLTQPAPTAAGGQDPGTRTKVPAVGQWRLPNGAQRVGTVAADVGAPAGTAISIWIDASGAPAPAPMSRDQIIMQAGLGVCYTALATLVLLAAAFRLVRWRLDRARFLAWEREWAYVEPRWMRRRGADGTP
ncbi:Rv1733c family protein [Gandjariella thermophila]|uniref:Transmembrane protein n=1 Tax=Gandjariella thermophila TaxID=1931992 RepID=A0A4D4JGN6_9PSEU|nr:hypothetical protein [Gandjariella thermophila]GDY33798.1 hypothetical protein GTS_54310 [Gandjariella thermophila]